MNRITALQVISLICVQSSLAFQQIHISSSTQKESCTNQNSSTSLFVQTSKRRSPPDTEDEARRKASPLSMTLPELTKNIGGKGKAQSSWDCFRVGIDPLLFYNPSYPEDALDNCFNFDHQMTGETGTEVQKDHEENYKSTREVIQEFLPSRRQTQSMGNKALKALARNYPSPLGIEPSIGSLNQITRSSDGTTKLLLKLSNTDHFIETVIIPHPEWNKSTLCISSQVGCAQGCVFCATGKMGKLASLTTDQILIQLYYANKICRVTEDLPQIDNIVFMGMGDAADNLDSVRKAVDVMTDRSCFALAPSKITISTVGPSPEAFIELAKADAVLAWSVHAARDDLRKKLVPTTKYSMEELKDGVVHALTDRSKRLRNLMLEITLIDGINDGVQEAEELSAFAQDLMDRVPGMKLMVNLIPFNDIGYKQYQRASDESVAMFQKVLVENGIKAYIRTTRGDEESSACGQLATKKRRKTVGP